MKILICYWGKKGGGAKYTYELAKEFVSQYNDDIYTSFSKNSHSFDELSNLAQKGFHIKTFNGFVGFVGMSIILPIKLLMLYFFLKKNKIDIVYTTMGHVWTPFLAILLKTVKIKHIFTVHDAKVHLGDKTMPFFLKKIIYKNAYKLVFLSEYVKNEFNKKFPINSNRIILSKHGILRYRNISTEPKKFNEVPYFRLVFFGRILKYKGLQYLLKAQLELEKRYNDVYLEIYGSGDISEYEQYLKKIKNIKLENRWIKDNEIYQIFSKPCINIVPYIEASQSGVIPVALSFGIPSIATNVGGLPEQLEDKINGLIVDIEDLETDLFKKIEYLYKNRHICDEFSKQCIHYVETKLSWKKIVRDLYREME